MPPVFVRKFQFTLLWLNIKATIVDSQDYHFVSSTIPRGLNQVIVDL